MQKFKRTTVLLTVALLVSLSGCGNKNNGDKKPNDPISRNVAGSMAGQTWSFSSGVAMPTESGFEITLAGNGESITCDASAARTNHLAFRVPNQLGTYNWDRANPGSGSSPLFFVYKFQTEHGYGSETVISQTSTINIIGITNNTLTGTVRGTSSGSGTKAGNVDGNFNIQICGSSDGRQGPVNPPDEALYNRIYRLQGQWNGTGFFKDDFSGQMQTTQMSFEVVLRGSDQVQFRVIDRNRGRTLFDSTLLVRNEFVEQMCIPDGSSVPRVERVGSYNRDDGTIAIQILGSDCSYSRTKVRFAEASSGLRLSGVYEKSDDRSRNRPTVEFWADSLSRF
ncbi:MAG: hypothetical protein M9962_15470 [Oligoflexia bacterium]|nr:hypothetical protein [Oligoflexia bacterium]